MSSDLALMPAHELVKLYKRKKASPVEATKAALARTERFNPVLNVFQHLDAEGALKAAKASERRWNKGSPAGPVDGVPVTLKDVLQTKGMPTLYGSRANDPAGPWTYDCPSAARLRESGAVFLGKTTSPEYGWKGVTDSPLFGITRNPWDIHKTPGGSSGGAAAATAVGIGNLSLGSDGAGSIRIPSAFTGLVGLKATFGRVAAYPASAMGTLSHVGPMTRNVRDAALLMNVVGRPDPRDPYSLVPGGESDDFAKGIDKGVKGLRIAYSRTLGFVRPDEIDPEVAASVDKAAKTLKKLGATVVEVEPTVTVDPRDIINVLWQAGASTLVNKFAAEKRALMDPGLLKSVAIGARHSTERYILVAQARDTLAAAFGEFMDGYDLLISPTMPMPALDVLRNAAHGGDGTDIAWTPFTFFFNLTRNPAATVPCGLTKAGLPIGLQIVGKYYAEALILRAAQAFEDATSIGLPPMATT